MVDICFANEFRELYARNNKSKLRKNMRCFPQCLASGHTENNFCGCGVRVVVSSSTFSAFEVSDHCDVSGRFAVPYHYAVSIRI
jgi:hypothetical protein